MSIAVQQPSESQARRASALKSALGPLMDFLTDDLVVEVMLNADGAVWIEKLEQGVLRTPVRMFKSDSEQMLRLVASEMLVELNAQSPSLSAKLPPPWGARLQAAIPPIVDAPVFALRKPARLVFSLDDYVKRQIILPSQRDALVAAVHAHDNILIGGGTGSGKTTFANALLKVIAEDTTDRVHIVEDTPELQCAAPNKVQVLVQPNVHGTPREVVPGTLGPVALFPSGELVAYVLRSRRRGRRVQLLLYTDSVGRSRLVRRLFAYLVKTSRDPAGLPDAFYLRVGVALAGRLPAHKILLSLLPPQVSLSESRTRVGQDDKGNDGCASLRPTIANVEGAQAGPALRTIQRNIS